jgi:hypothetical protein
MVPRCPMHTIRFSGRAASHSQNLVYMYIYVNETYYRRTRDLFYSADSHSQNLVSMYYTHTHTHTHTHIYISFCQQSSNLSF